MHDIEPVQSNAGSVAYRVANAAQVDADVAGKKQRRAAIDDGSTFLSAFGKVVFLRRRHDDLGLGRGE
jgi:hypothetical protein